MSILCLPGIVAGIKDPKTNILQVIGRMCSEVWCKPRKKAGDLKRSKYRNQWGQPGLKSTSTYYSLGNKDTKMKMK